MNSRSELKHDFWTILLYHSSSYARSFLGKLNIAKMCRRRYEVIDIAQRMRDKVAKNWRFNKGWEDLSDDQKSEDVPTHECK